MRDRSGWYQSLVAAMRPWPEAHADIKPALLCQVELGLRLLERLEAQCPADGVWTLLGGYPFADAEGLASTADRRLALAAARHLLWPMRRRRVWQQSLEAYWELPERLRGYRAREAPQPPRSVPSVPVAAHRFDVYDAALGRLPDFATRTLPQAEAGSYRFLDGRRRTSVVIPEHLVQQPPAGHDLAAGRPGPSGPCEVPLSELAETARWMDAKEANLRLKPGHWESRLQDLGLDTRDADGTSFRTATHLRLDGLTHLVGMVGSGKSTLMTLLAVWAHHRKRRITLVVGDVAEQLALTELFISLGLSAAPVQGGTTREQHAQRLHRRLAGRGRHSLLSHTDHAFRHLSTACPLDALRGLDAAAPLRYADAPCAGLHPAPAPKTTANGDEHHADSRANRLAELRAHRGGRPVNQGNATPSEETEEELADPHSCPLWAACPRHHATRSLVDALIWVANPASLVLTAAPPQLGGERLRYLELACLRSDIVIVDEADRVQMQLDRMFAPAATLIARGPDSWLDQLQTHEIAELARQGRLPLSDRDVARWSTSLDVVSAAANRLYTRLIGDRELREWAQIDYFSAWTLQERLLQEWYPPKPPADGEEGENVATESDLFLDDEGLDTEGEGDAPARGGDDCAARREAVTAVFDTFRDDPLGDQGPYGSETDGLTTLTHDLLHTLNEKQLRSRSRKLLDRLLAGAPKAHERTEPTPPRKGRQRTPADAPLSEEWYERAASRLEFTLILAALHQRLDRVTFLWPQVEAALHLDTNGNDLTRRPPLDYAPLVPEAPMGNVLGFQYLPDDDSRAPDPEGRRSGTLRFFRYAGVGRELLLGLDRLGTQPEEHRAGPNVLLMSGTSWAGSSTRAHVSAPVRAVLRPDERTMRAVGNTHFRVNFLYDDGGRPIRLSGQHPDDRGDVLRLMVNKLARNSRNGEPSPLQHELAQIADERRKRALLLVGSYREAAIAAQALEEIPRWRGGVRVLAADDAELEEAVHGDRGSSAADTGKAMPVRRGDLASFAEDPDARLLVAPLLAIERGHNILTVPRPGQQRVAAFGTVFFLARPHPRPDDLSLAVFAVNDWATRFVRDQPGLEEGTFGELVRSAGDLNEAGREFRRTARGVWRRLLSRPYIYSVLSESEKRAFAWDQLVAIWQVIGRLVRGGVPARVVFVDAAFAPALAAAQAPPGESGTTPRWLRDEGLLFRLRDVLAPYFDDDGAPPPRQCADPADPALVRLLYEPLYGALCRLGTDNAVTDLPDRHLPDV